MTNDIKAPGLPVVPVAKIAQYKLDYFVRKHDLTTIRARSILAKAGGSRDKANAAAILANSK